MQGPELRCGKSTLAKVHNLHNGSVDGILHNWHSSSMPCGANSLFLCKLHEVLCKLKVQQHTFRYWPCGTIVYVKTLISLCYYNPESFSNQLLRHSWKHLLHYYYGGYVLLVMCSWVCRRHETFKANYLLIKSIYV